jgi:hypothetical protein
MAKVDAKHKGPSFWERLQPRERVLVMALAGVALLMFTLVLMFMRYQKLSVVDEEIADIRQGLDLARTFGPSYKEKLAIKQQASEKVSTQKLMFSTLIEQAAEVAEVKVSNQAEKPAVEVAPGLQRRTYEFDLRSVTLAQLTKFLSTVEGEEGHVVLTHGLTIRSPSGSEDRLNVDVVLATYERIPAVASAAGAGG